jgi:MFS family permease
MAEPLIPVFLFALIGSYGISGAIDSVGELVFLLVLPLAGVLADRIPLKTYLIIGLGFFFLDGLWSLAALWSIAAFAVVAYLFDGIAVASDVVGRATYIRRYGLQEKVASIMGFQEALGYFGWLLGALISLALVSKVSFSWIFFGIVPANAFALWMIAVYLPKDKAQNTGARQHFSIAEYFKVWAEASNRHSGLRLYALLMTLFYALTSFATFLIPIYAYLNGASLQEIIVLGIISMSPQLLSSPLGKAADRFRGKLLPIGLAGVALTLLVLGFAHTYALLLAVVLIMQTLLLLLSLVLENLVTAATSADRYGRVSAVFEGLKDLGKGIGALGLGFAVDHIGAGNVFYALAACALLIALSLLPRWSK